MNRATSKQLKVGQTVYTLEREVTPTSRGDYYRVYALANRVISYDNETIVTMGKYGLTFISWDSENLYLTAKEVVERLQQIMDKRAEQVKAEGLHGFIQDLSYCERPQEKK